MGHLILDDKTSGVKSGEIVIPSSAGFQRFCSSFLATEKEGFDRDILFMNEESPDWFLRQENSWPPPLNDPAQRQAGLVIAYDVKKGTYKPIYGMGRHTHENSVAIPGFKENVVLSGDDTFTSGPLTGVSAPPPGGPSLPGVVPAQSQLYSYIAKDTKKLLEDKGDLWAFVSDTPGVENYYDVLSGSGTNVTGHFIKVPKDIASGLKSDDLELMAADKGYPPPPDNGTWQRDSRISTASAPTVVAGSGVDGPQWVLEYWSDINNVFQFVRVEDIAYDKRKGEATVAYIVDSGRGRASGSDTPFRSTNGRVWKMVFDKKDPTIVTSLTVFVEGDDNPVKTVGEVHQPDNIESTKNGLLLTEDPGSSQQFPAGSTDPNATTARLWWIPFTGDPAVVARVDQSTDNNPAFDRNEKLTPGNWGAWEKSGIVDASKAFGKDMFLLNVQAHTLWIDKEPGADNFGLVAGSGPDGVKDYTNKREGGQMVLIKIPGAS